MNNSQPLRAGIGIRLFDVALRWLIAGLALASAAALVLLALYLTGRGPIALPARLEPPYAIQLLDGAGREIEVGESGTIVRYTNFDIGEESRYIKSAPAVIVNARVDRTDTDTRVVTSVVGLALLSVAWVIVVNLEAIVLSARRGDPFAARNVRRLRRIAIALPAVPVIRFLLTRVVERTLEVDPAVAMFSLGWAWTAFLVVALALLALAEVFKAGASLQAFERETI